MPALLRTRYETQSGCGASAGPTAATVWSVRWTVVRRSSLGRRGTAPCSRRGSPRCRSRSGSRPPRRPRRLRGSWLRCRSRRVYIEPAPRIGRADDRTVIRRSFTGHARKPLGSRARPDEDPGNRGRGSDPLVPRARPRSGGIPSRGSERRTRRARSRGPGGVGSRAARPDAAGPQRARRARRAAPQPAGAAGAHPLGARRPADEAARLRARRVGLRVEAGRARRAARARPRAAAALAPRR